MRISDWSSDVCSSDLRRVPGRRPDPSRGDSLTGAHHMKPSIILSALLLASAQLPAWAQQPVTAPARNAQNQERPLVARTPDDQVTSDWGLQPQEWARYRELMDGPLGIYSPNLDPLSALGIEARTDEERRRYAELHVQVQHHPPGKLP